MEYSHSQQKSPEWGIWVQSQKWENDLCSFPRQTIQYHSNPSLCPNQYIWRTWTALQRLTRPFRTNTPKRCPFHYRGLECKSRKSRDTWSNRQVWPWSTKWSRAKANTVLPRECTGHSKHPLPTTTQGKTLHLDNTEIRLIIFFATKDREALYSQQNNKTKQKLELTVAHIISSSLQIQAQIEESKETTSPFRYDLNQTPVVIQ